MAGPTKPVALASPVKLRVKTWEHHYTFYVNDALMLNVSDPDFEPGDLMWVGTPTWFTQTGEATFSNLRVRRLDEKPDTEHIVN